MGPATWSLMLLNPAVSTSPQGRRHLSNSFPVKGRPLRWQRESTKCRRNASSHPGRLEDGRSSNFQHDSRPASNLGLWVMHDSCPQSWKSVTVTSQDLHRFGAAFCTEDSRERTRHAWLDIQVRFGPRPPTANKHTQKRTQTQTPNDTNTETSRTYTDTQTQTQIDQTKHLLPQGPRIE